MKQKHQRRPNENKKSGSNAAYKKVRCRTLDSTRFLQSILDPTGSAVYGGTTKCEDNGNVSANN